MVMGLSRPMRSLCPMQHLAVKNATFDGGNALPVPDATPLATGMRGQRVW